MKIQAMHLVLILIFGFAISPALAETHFCKSHSFDSVSFKWCADFTDRKRNPDIIYNFYGSGGTENDWINANENIAIEREWKKLGVAAPTIITISLGEEWLLTDLSFAGKPPLYPLMVNKIIPYVETELGGLKGRRFLKGVSMGGFNGAELLLKNGELFDRVALICPVIAEIGPFSTRSEIDQYIEARRDFINKDMVEELVRDLKEEFPTPEDYARHNPLVLVEKTRIKTPFVYISCADHDEYGFFESSEKFAESVQNQGAKVFWHPTHGGHCVVDAKKLAEFFAPSLVCE